MKLNHTFHLELEPTNYQKVLFGTLHHLIKQLIIDKCNEYDCIKPKWNDTMLINYNGYYVFIYMRANVPHMLYHRLDIDMDSIEDL